ncbi:hypothetical protein HPP92_008733 [Vanilla planifolia]|uniref:PPPDE domain-containing protein n=1 Tax=Vanilla planifolia TaxID=51239 RepID=A0A835V6P3_VANPL|nr:hypothetical protein HPP92_008733 [Vanilla planifolia]
MVLDNEVYGDEEWSFGYCEYGSGIFSCPPTKNPMYTYRESIVLGETTFTNYMVNEIMWELQREWTGISYDLLSRNCNHFCDAFCEGLGVPKLPAWVNRFANAGDAALVAAENTAVRLQQAKTEIVSATKVAYRFLASVASNSPGSSPGSNGNSSSSFSRFRASWFKDLVPAGAIRSPSSTHLIESSNSDNKSPLSLPKRMECTRSNPSSV